MSWWKRFIDWCGWEKSGPLTTPKPEPQSVWNFNKMKDEFERRNFTVTMGEAS